MGVSSVKNRDFTLYFGLSISAVIIVILIVYIVKWNRYR